MPRNGNIFHKGKCLYFAFFFAPSRSCIASECLCLSSSWSLSPSTDGSTGLVDRRSRCRPRRPRSSIPPPSPPTICFDYVLSMSQCIPSLFHVFSMMYLTPKSLYTRCSRQGPHARIGSHRWQHQPSNIVADTTYAQILVDFHMWCRSKIPTWI